MFLDKFERAPCKQFLESQVTYFEYSNVTSKSFSCVNFQGGAKLLRKMLYKFRANKSTNSRDDRIVLILNTESVLHDYWQSPIYWQARRSMRFNKALAQLADDFRETVLNDADGGGLVVRPKSWCDEVEHRTSVGGAYLAAHLRRSDFLYGREKTTPTLLSASVQLKRKLRQLNLTTVFLASDCTGHEFLDFKNLMRPFRVVKYTPESRSNELNDGSVAIIDQIIASYAR